MKKNHWQLVTISSFWATQTGNEAVILQLCCHHQDIRLIKIFAGKRNPSTKNIAIK